MEEKYKSFISILLNDMNYDDRSYIIDKTLANGNYEFLNLVMQLNGEWVSTVAIRAFHAPIIQMKSHFINLDLKYLSICNYFTPDSLEKFRWLVSQEIKFHIDCLVQSLIVNDKALWNYLYDNCEVGPSSINIKLINLGNPQKTWIYNQFPDSKDKAIYTIIKKHPEQ